MFAMFLSVFNQKKKQPSRGEATAKESDLLAEEQNLPSHATILIA